MLLVKYYDGIEIHRNEKLIFVKLLVPHRVISTCRVNGGMCNGLKLIFNHQSCEPAGHYCKSQDLAVRDPVGYLRQVCRRYKVSQNSASLGTAANMNCAAIKRKTFRDLEVVAICTAGVETNAGRAGDPAVVYENEGVYESVAEGTLDCSNTTITEPDGTINTILCINRELTPGALVRTIITATEAKTATLWELNVNSRYSDTLATGTGTDQIAVASKIGDSVPLSGAGKHTKLGELIGRTVKEAVAEALHYQNKLTPQNQRSVVIHIERFGTNSETIKDEVARYLSEDKATLFKKNFIGVDRDPVTVAAVAALVHLRDKLAWKILPESCLMEVFVTHGAHVSAAVAGKYDRYPIYYSELSRHKFNLSNSSFLELVYRSIATGFEDKWEFYETPS